MKGLGSKVTKGLQVGSRIACHDNSGAKEVEVINVLNVRGVRNRYPMAGIGDVLIVSVKKGKPEMVKKVVRALIVRQKMPYKRPNGLTIMFEDNAVVLVTEDGLPVGTEIKGVVAKEITERYPKVSAIAPGVI
ncbi:50S ribosomal protein L14 [Candidatus Micrarchaeota archaeon]|nr:50S ribosomal protein L14 [Candidatus Micrarchaeota archaeon]